MGLHCVAWTVNDLGEVTAALALTKWGAERRLIRRFDVGTNLKLVRTW